MLRRILYHMKYRFLSILQETVIYLLLFTFFIGSLLTIQLSGILNTVLSQNSDMNVSVYSSITYPVQKLECNYDKLAREETYTDIIQKASRLDGIDYYDYSISANMVPLKPVQYREDGTYLFYSTLSPEPITVPYDPEVSYGISLKGITNADTEALHDGSIMTYRDGESGFLTQEKINSNEMICFLPASSYASWYDSSTMEKIDPEYFTVSTAVTDENGTVSSYKEWNLKVAGTYLMHGTMYISNSDGSGELPVYMPLGTLLNIRNEAFAFQNEYNHDWQKNITFDYQLDAVHPVTFQMHDLSSAKKLISFLQSTDAYQEGDLGISSSITENAPVYTSIYSITSSFSLLSMIIAVITVIFAAISTLLIAIKNRKEMTLLQALGEKNNRIVMQSVMENGLQMILSMVIAIPLSLSGVRKFGIYLFDSSIRDQTSTLSSALKYTFSLNDIQITPEMMKEMLKITPYILLFSFCLILVTLVISFIITQQMIRHFEPREVLNQEAR